MADLKLHALLTEVAKEELSPGIRDTLPALSPLFSKIHNTWEGVVQNNIGRPGRNASGAYYNADWVYRWIWRTAIGGYFKFSAPNPALYTDIGADNVAVGKTNANFPGIADHVTTRYANPFIALAEGRGSIHVPWQLLRYNKLSSIMTDVLAQEIQNSAELVSQTEAAVYFSRNPDWGELLRSRGLKPGAAVHGEVLRTEIDGTTADTSRITFTRIDGDDPIQRVRPGMSVDIYEVHFDIDAGADASELTIVEMSSAGNGFVCDQVDFLGPSSIALGTGRVSFVDKDGGTADTPKTAAALDILVYIVTIRESLTATGLVNATDVVLKTPVGLLTTATQGLQDGVDTLLRTTFLAATHDGSVDVVPFSSGYGPDGLESFIKTEYSDTLYGISIGRLPQLKSMGLSLTTADYLTERRLNDWIGWFMSQYGANKCFDTILTSNGVLNGYFANLVGPTSIDHSTTSDTPHTRMMYERGGKKMQETTGWETLVVTYRGKRFEVIDDPLCTRNTMYGLKTKNQNFKRLMPPPIPGSDKKPHFRDIEFVASLGGSRGIFKWSHNSSGQTTDWLEAPYVATFQHFVTDPASLKVRNLLESTGYTVT
jgi:hypothetical protein